MSIALVRENGGHGCGVGDKQDAGGITIIVKIT